MQETAEPRGPAGATSFASAPLAAWVLLALGAIAVVAELLGRGFIAPDPVTPAQVAVDLLPAMPFLVAAAAITGAAGWPAGRSWLLAGAAGFMVAGLLALAYLVWFWIVVGSNGGLASADPFYALWWNGGNAVRAAAEAIAPLALALGLWSARRGTPGRSGRRTLLLLGIGLLGVVAAVLWIAVATRSLPGYPAAIRLAYACYALEGATLAGLAGIAVASAPAGGAFPERIIGVGAALLLVVQAVLGAVELDGLVNGSAAWLLSVYGWTITFSLVAWVMLSTGLALGRGRRPSSATG